jgi:hypothetical protein
MNEYNIACPTCDERYGFMESNCPNCGKQNTSAIYEYLFSKPGKAVIFKYIGLALYSLPSFYLWVMISIFGFASFFAASVGVIFVPLITIFHMIINPFSEKRDYEKWDAHELTSFVGVDNVYYSEES